MNVKCLNFFSASSGQGHGEVERISDLFLQTTWSIQSSSKYYGKTPLSIHSHLGELQVQTHQKSPKIVNSLIIYLPVALEP